MNKNKIVDFLKQHNNISSFDKLANNLHAYDHVLLTDELKEMQEENILVLTENKNVYLLGEKYKYGELRLNPKGFGFVSDFSDDKIENSFVPPVCLANCFNEDEVVYTVEKETDGRLKAKVVELVKREKEFLIGEIVSSKDGQFLDFYPTDLSFSSFRVVMVNKAEFSIKPNQIVKAKILYSKERKLFVRLKKVIGDMNKAADRILSIAEEMNIKIDFDKATIANANEVTKPIDSETNELAKREKTSLIGKMIVTIDGNDSKDLDDAICVEKMSNGNFKLYVAIADVSYYVKPKTPLDREALKRGNSTYLANKVIPMLPQILSNDLCSLNPDTKKLAMVCEMEFNQYGNVLSKKVYESIIVSKYRLTYDEVNKLYEQGSWSYPNELGEMMNEAYKLYKLIDDVKIKRGTINFDIREPKIVMDADSNVIDIKARTTGESEKLIEQFMVSANESVAELIFDKDLPYIYRNHGKPQEDDLIAWYASLKLYGINPKLTPKEMTDPINISKALKQISEQVTDMYEEELLNLSLLRYMDKAKYGLENIGHFGLSSPCYTHFTSPIRRYSDLMVHRYLKQYIVNNNFNKHQLEDNENFIVKASHIINETEVTSVDCEREVNKACMAEYMQDKIGEIHEGIIVAVLKFGIFVQLHNMVEGLVHISNLEEGIIYDEAKQILVKPDNTYYRMGQKVKIKVDNVDIRKRKIDFILVK